MKEQFIEQGNGLLETSQQKQQNSDNMTLFCLAGEREERKILSDSFDPVNDQVNPLDNHEPKYWLFFFPVA